MVIETARNRQQQATGSSTGHAAQRASDAARQCTTQETGGTTMATQYRVIDKRYYYARQHGPFNSREVAEQAAVALMAVPGPDGTTTETLRGRGGVEIVEVRA